MVSLLFHNPKSIVRKNVLSTICTHFKLLPEQFTYMRRDLIDLIEV